MIFFVYPCPLDGSSWLQQRRAVTVTRFAKQLSVAEIANVWVPFDDQFRALLQLADVGEPTAKKLADAGGKDMPLFAAAAASPEDFAAWAAELGLDRLSRASLFLAWKDARSKFGG